MDDKLRAELDRLWAAINHTRTQMGCGPYEDFELKEPEPEAKAPKHKEKK